MVVVRKGVDLSIDRVNYVERRWDGHSTIRTMKEEVMYSKPEDLVLLLNIANDFRRAKKGHKLRELPEAEAANPFQCIIAKAFNFSCSVYPAPMWTSGQTPITRGTIYFQSLEDANTFCKVMDSNEIPQKVIRDGTKWIVHMPNELNAVALDFDAGHLNEKFYED